MERAFYRVLFIVLTGVLCSSCASSEKNWPVVCRLADPALIDWDNAKVTADTNIIRYGGKPFSRVSERDKQAEGAVNSYIAWKGGKEPLLPVKTAVEERFVEDWRAIRTSPTEAFIAGGAFQKPPGVIDQSWILEPKNSRIKDGPQLLRARKSCTLTSLSNGKILISGGLDGSGSPINDCECFDPKTESVSKFPSLALPRCGHTVIEYGDGQLLVVGGKTSANLANSVGDLTSKIERWSPVNKQFEVIGTAKRASFQPQLFLINKNQVLIARGHLFSGESETDESPPAEIYTDLEP
ncbi:MAG: hypothetical protein K2Y39_06995 [Candidatus Obscuribacterales bacterium]|nr:hypothetical protein [Candidatus Obscuribacterales bacterium]